MNRRYLRRGVYLAFGIILCAALAFVVCMGFGYDGTCGGFFPGLSARRPCSFVDYMLGDALAIAMIFAVSYWPVALALLLMAPAVGYFLDCRASR